jgi:gas vesicle protein
MSRGRIIIGVLAGLAAGTLIGILFAPDKGSETRKKIINKGEDYVDNLKEKINGILHDGRKHAERVGENVSSAM